MLSLWFSPFDERRKKSIRPVLSRKCSEETVASHNALHPHRFPQAVLDRGPRVRNLKNVTQSAQDFADNRFVFLRLKRASGIHQPPIRRQMRQSVSKQSRLPVVQVRQVFLTEFPQNFRVSAERARAGAGNVD